VSPERSKKKPSSKKQSAAEVNAELKGWTDIARYLGIPIATAHRWASEGMPVRREGRFTVADREAVSAWPRSRVAHARARARDDRRR